MYDRARYKSDQDTDWRNIPDPVGMYKYDGANYFMQVEGDGSLRFFSRRPSVKGGFPERTAALPHITKTKLPQFAHNVYNVELIHTGHSKNHKESHPAVSGILNSLPPRAIETQESTGPVRVVLHNVISPDLPTFKDKLLHLKSVQDSFRDPNLLWVAEPHIGHAAIQKLIEHTKKHGREGVVIASLTRPEASNFRVKIKHQDHYNLLVTRILQEYDTKGNPKQSMGSLELSDKSGRVVGNVGTGFTPALRREIWNNKDEWLGKLIQINTMGLARHRLRMPVYNGEADGELDLVE